ncbi:MAG TPA: hypothetical protein VEJ88_04865, partial [Dissulfurispiraceae bacterium]|nr:hypothetical protein [Dissulfurispiraceae bacterium]
VGLRVEVDHQCTRPACGGNGGQVAGDRALAYTTFLIEDDALHGSLITQQKEKFQFYEAVAGAG